MYNNIDIMCNFPEKKSKFINLFSKIKIESEIGISNAFQFWSKKQIRKKSKLGVRDEIVPKSRIIGSKLAKIKHSVLISPFHAIPAPR